MKRDTMPPAVAELYRVFKRVRLSNDFAENSDGYPPAEAAHLTSVSLQHLAKSQLDRYTFKAMTTWGTVQDFKYFLPQIGRAHV